MGRCPKGEKSVEESSQMDKKLDFCRCTKCLSVTAPELINEDGLCIVCRSSSGLSWGAQGMEGVADGQKTGA